jgi:glucose-6-phosphate isomerase, archaeal
MSTFYPGFDISTTADPPGFRYGAETFGPTPEMRSLNAIRASLREPDCAGPDPVYAIAMDVGRRTDEDALRERGMLFGAVCYAAGRLGSEPVRSQGHVHKVSRHSEWPPPEVYEVWAGRAFIYMQERVDDDPGRCFAIRASPGDIVIVPPGWAHATISADIDSPVAFGALCDRECGFVYDGVRRRRGLAWYARIAANQAIDWEPNPNYRAANLEVREPGNYSAFGLRGERPLYTQVVSDLQRFQWISKPGLVAESWRHFEP